MFRKSAVPSMVFVVSDSRRVFHSMYTQLQKERSRLFLFISGDKFREMKSLTFANCALMRPGGALVPWLLPMKSRIATLRAPTRGAQKT
jgi:hypothetical protein